MKKSSGVEAITQSENFFGFSIMLIAALVTAVLVYNQQGLTIYVLLIPLVVVGALFFAYESFKAFLRVIGRELERGKSEAVEERGKGKLLMLVCPKCKAKNPSDAAYCFSCGEKL
ncbi:MAG: zinc ribbon domain-containing protein [Candidatus Micrarchaeia archaeon]